MSSEWAGWSELHGGVQPSRLVRGWLRLVHGIARQPVVERMPPDVLSGVGVAVAGGAVAAAWAGGGWCVLAALLVVLTGVLDGLDGAVALRTGRARPLGAVVDAMADRIGDLALVAVLHLLGAPGVGCVAVGSLLLLHEYLRSRAQAAGLPGVGAVTVAERPTRIILVALAALGTGALPDGTPLTHWPWASVSVAVWVVVAVVGLVQLGAAVIRQMPPR